MDRPYEPDYPLWILLHPTTEDEPIVQGPPLLASPGRNGSRRWRSVAAGLICVVAAAIPGAGTSTGWGSQSSAAGGFGSPSDGARERIVSGEWLHLVGTPAAESRPAGWGVVTVARTTRLGDWFGGMTVFDEDTLPSHLRAVGLRSGDLGETGLALTWWAARPGGVAAPASTASGVSLPPVLDGFSHHQGPSAWVEGVNYSDPTGAGLPLRRARGAEDERVSPNFLVRDFATRDGAPYLRIAPDLVTGLERMRATLGALTVISAYRHPQYNALPSVGGVPFSQHQSGQAADVWSPTASTPEMALAAIQAMGCGIGIGLGRNTIHVDVRGHLSTWTYRGAPLSGATFHRWVLGLCGGVAPAAPRGDPRLRGTPWHVLSPSDAQDGEERVHIDSDTPGVPDESHVSAGASPASADAEERGPGGGVAERAHAGLARFAQSQQLRRGLGVVVADLKAGEAVTESSLLAGARFLEAGHPEIEVLGVGSLLRWVRARPVGTYFAYVIRREGAQVATGVAPLARPEGRWLLLVATETELAKAEAALARHERPLRVLGLGVVLRAEGGEHGTRYDIVVGPFQTESDAERAAIQAAEALPDGARVVALD